jgi:hypothetical protein
VLLLRTFFVAHSAYARGELHIILCNLFFLLVEVVSAYIGQFVRHYNPLGEGKDCKFYKYVFLSTFC